MVLRGVPSTGPAGVSPADQRAIIIIIIIIRLALTCHIGLVDSPPP